VREVEQALETARIEWAATAERLQEKSVELEVARHEREFLHGRVMELQYRQRRVLQVLALTAVVVTLVVVAYRFWPV
jgi:hypothetical protein